eukprot:761665-Hanusia_phi.AAC.4
MRISAGRGRREGREGERERGDEGRQTSQSVTDSESASDVEMLRSEWVRKRVEGSRRNMAG